MASKPQIISLAFNLLGKPPVNDPTTGNPIEQAAADVYDLLLIDILTCHPWRFAMLTRELAKLAAKPPVDRWQFAFQLPSDLLLPYRTEPIMDYEIFENKMYTNNSEVTLDYLAKVDESRFPSYFTQLMVDELASRIAMLVTQNIQIEIERAKRALRTMLRAKNADSQQMPNPRIQRDEIIAARGGGPSSLPAGS